MKKLLRLTRHAIAVLAGATTIWIVLQSIFVLMRAIPGLGSRVAEWTALHPPSSASTSFLVSTLVAIALSVIQEAPRTRGLSYSLWTAAMFGVVTLDSRIASTPRHLMVVVVIFAILRAAGVISGAAMMYWVKGLLRDREAVAGGGDVAPDSRAV